MAPVVSSTAMPSFTSGAGHIVLTPRVSKANDVTQWHKKTGSNDKADILPQMSWNTEGNIFGIALLSVKP